MSADDSYTISDERMEEILAMVVRGKYATTPAPGINAHDLAWAIEDFLAERDSARRERDARIGVYTMVLTDSGAAE